MESVIVKTTEALHEVYTQAPVAAADAAPSAGVSTVPVAFGGVFALLFIILAVLAIYVIPTIIALARRHSQKVPIIVINLLLGWCFIGWIVALVWSLINEKTPYNNVNNGMYNNNGYNNFNNNYNNTYNNHDNM